MDKVAKAVVLLEAAKIRQAVDHLVESIAREYREEPVVLVGVQTRGVSLARRLAKGLTVKLGREIPVGMLDINFYRDDLDSIHHQPTVKETDIPFDVLDKTIILVDDVLYTGRTVRSALDALVDYGRPRAIRLAVLIDRGARELPIQADFVGDRVNVKPGDRVNVHLEENDGEDSVFLGLKNER